MENNLKILANNLVNYSCKITRGQKVLIEASVVAIPLVRELIKEIYKVNAFPFVKLSDSTITKEIISNTDEQHSKLMAGYMMPVISDMDAYIGVSGSNNIYELSSVNSEKMQAFNIHYSKPIHHDVRVTKTKWVILKYPTPGFAQLSSTSTEEFNQFYFNVCNLNYSKMNKAMQQLKQLMEKTSQVRIVAPNTDLSFSIKDIPAIICAGEMNIPDGEIYTAPVKNSVNGKITYNVPSLYNGIKFNNISLTFKDGKIIEATCSENSEKLNEIFNTDEGARFVGEFAIGVNPYILEPMMDILFDEKICGSLHFTPGSCYNDAYNGNQSAIHWDLVLIQREDKGGGEIWFDNVLIRKNGIFVIDELKDLNPENLK